MIFQDAMLIWWSGDVHSVMLVKLSEAPPLRYLIALTPYFSRL